MRYMVIFLLATLLLSCSVAVHSSDEFPSGAGVFPPSDWADMSICVFGDFIKDQKESERFVYIYDVSGGSSVVLDRVAAFYGESDVVFRRYEPGTVVWDDRGMAKDRETGQNAILLFIENIEFKSLDSAIVELLIGGAPTFGGEKFYSLKRVSGHWLIEGVEDGRMF